MDAIVWECCFPADWQSLGSKKGFWDLRFSGLGILGFKDSGFKVLRFKDLGFRNVGFGVWDWSLRLRGFGVERFRGL